MKIFISHKREDSFTANQIANELKLCNVACYLDVLDESITQNGKELTDHIRGNLNECTDIIVVMSSVTYLSQWVPFEVGMAAQVDMPTATFLKENINLPDFLQYWPRLRNIADIRKYVLVSKDVDREYQNYRTLYEAATSRQKRVERFYDVLKQRL